MLSTKKLSRSFVAVLGAVLSGLLANPSWVYAHGMGLDEMAPPVMTSIGLGLACYWLIVLWPSNKSKNVPALGMTGPVTDEIRIKQKPRLRVVERRLVNE